MTPYIIRLRPEQFILVVPCSYIDIKLADIKVKRENGEIKHALIQWPSGYISTGGTSPRKVFLVLVIKEPIKALLPQHISANFNVFRCITYAISISSTDPCGDVWCCEFKERLSGAGDKRTNGVTPPRHLSANFYICWWCQWNGGGDKNTNPPRYIAANPGTRLPTAQLVTAFLALEWMSISSSSSSLFAGFL